MKFIVFLIALASCETNLDVSYLSDPVLSARAPLPQVIVDSHDILKGLSEHPLTGATMTSTDSNREMLTLLVACAFDSSTSITPNGIEFFGETGLATQWQFGPLNEDGKEWVSACVMAHLSSNGTASPISMRGRNKALASSRDEVTGWPLEEGAFYGNIFTAPARMIDWNACAGRDIVERSCAIQDPAHPDVTVCGLAFDGQCSQVCERTSKFFNNCRGSNRFHRHVITVFDTK